MWPISFYRTQDASEILISSSYFCANISKLELENSFLENFYLSNFWIRNFAILHHYLHENCPPICKNLSMSGNPSMSGNHHLFDFKLYKTTDGTVERNNLKPIKSKSANPSEPYEYQFEMNPQNRYMIITLRQCRSWIFIRF